MSRKDPGPSSESKVLRDRYALDQRIGFGGMGAVYIAHDRVMDRKVAVKELRAEYSDDELLRRRFIREAQAAGCLSHPHIVTVHDLIEEGMSLFIVMEFLDGGTLLDRMNGAPGRRLEIDVALEITRQALLGLEAAHDEGLVHRDVKPGNLLFDQRGRVKIADFGVVTARETEDTLTALTQAGTHPGTLVYMAPEQIDGAEVDGRSDVYSMGAVLYECLAGKRYFESPSLRRTERALMDAICEKPPVPLRSRVPYVPEAVERLVSWALRKDVEERPSAAQLADAIRDVQRAPRPQPQIVTPGRPAARGGDEVETRAASASPPSPVAPPRIQEALARATRPVRRRRRSDEGSGPRLEIPAKKKQPAKDKTPRPAPARGTPAQGTPSPPERRQSARRKKRTRRRTEVIVAPTLEGAQGETRALEKRPQDDGVWVHIPRSSFLRGSEASSDEFPQRRITVSAFQIDRTPVTIGQYARFLEAIRSEGPPAVPLLRRLYPNGKDHRPQGWRTPELDALCPTPEHPVVFVDWFDACAYAAWVGARLPTEAEWERTARGAQDARPHPWGDAPPDPSRAVFGRRTLGPLPVGQRAAGASPEGVLDLTGNTWEWCLDHYDPQAYEHSVDVDPLLEVQGPQARAVKRGGSWTNAAVSIRCSKRGFEKLHIRRNNLGFRCARSR